MPKYKKQRCAKGTVGVSEAFNGLLKDMQKYFDRNMIGEASVDDLKEELEDFSKGIRRNEWLNQGLKK